MTEQLDMFPAPTSAVSSLLVGLEVKLDRRVDRERPCCTGICIIKAGTGPHASALHCVTCDRFRGG